MHRCTNADSKGTTTGGHGGTIDIYRDESPGNYDATQLRHQEMNAIQEEIAYVIEEEGGTLNTDSETPSSGMDQLNTAIENKLVASRIVNDSGVSGANVDDALDVLDTKYTPGFLIGFDMVLSAGVSNSQYLAWSSTQINKCRSFDDTISMELGAYSKGIIDTAGTGYQAWAPGTGSGGVPSGVPAISQGNWLYVFAIKNPTSGVVDIGVDSSLAATNLLAAATGFTKYRRIGVIQIMNAGGGLFKIRPFMQKGDWVFWHDSYLYDHNAALSIQPSVSSINMSSNVPPTIETIARIRINCTHVKDTGVSYFEFWENFDPLGSLGTSRTEIRTIPVGNGDSSQQNILDIFCFGTPTIKAMQRSTTTATNPSVLIQAIGFKDVRGRNGTA
jgi:hypothetical protein